MNGDDFTEDDLIVSPREYVCPRAGCHLIHLRAAGDSACDQV